MTQTHDDVVRRLGSVLATYPLWYRGLHDKGPLKKKRIKKEKARLAGRPHFLIQGTQLVEGFEGTGCCAQERAKLARPIEGGVLLLF
jgi:hypothetical protein